MKIKKFYDLIKKGNTDEIVDILSYKYFNEYTNIKNIYNRIQIIFIRYIS